MRSVAAWQSASSGPPSVRCPPRGRCGIHQSIQTSTSQYYTDLSQTATLTRRMSKTQISLFSIFKVDSQTLAGRALDFTRTLQGAIVWGGRRYAAVWFVAVRDSESSSLLSDADEDLSHPHPGQMAKKSPRRGFRLVMLPMQSSRPMSRVSRVHIMSSRYICHEAYTAMDTC